MDHELDYVREATMCDRLRQAVAHDDPADDVIRVPAVFHELSTDRLLVMEEAPGRPIDAPGAIAASGAPAHLLAAALLDRFLEQVLHGMVFHADPHPGNLMVDQWGRLWLLDFGAVGLLDPVDPPGPPGHRRRHERRRAGGGGPGRPPPGRGRRHRRPAVPRVRHRHC